MAERGWVRPEGTMHEKDGKQAVPLRIAGEAGARGYALSGMRVMVDRALQEMSSRTSRLYSARCEEKLKAQGLSSFDLSVT